MITENQEVSSGYKEWGGHGRGLRMLQRRGNKVSMGIFILSKSEISIMTLSIHGALFHSTFATDILALLL